MVTVHSELIAIENNSRNFFTLCLTITPPHEIMGIETMAKGAKMLDAKRAKIQSYIDNAATPKEAELAQALLYGYDLGELKVLTNTATGELLFALNEEN